jgi:hypothetical protein
MSDAGEVLRAVLERDRAVLDDAELLKNHLLDRMPENRADINLLVAAAREGIPARVASAAALTEATVAELASRLSAEQGLTRDRAAWAVRAWMEGLGRVAVTGVPAPALTSSPRRVSTGVLAAGALLVVAGVLALGWRGSAVYALERVAFFYTDGPLASDAGELLNYHAWCEAGAELRTSGPPPHRCPIVSPFAPATPRIKVELRVSVPTRATASVAYRCALAHQDGRVVTTVSSTGELGRGTPGPAERVVWLTAFERPMDGWTPGRYRVACDTPEQSIEGWLDIKSMSAEP